MWLESLDSFLFSLGDDVAGTPTHDFIPSLAVGEMWMSRARTIIACCGLVIEADTFSVFPPFKLHEDEDLLQLFFIINKIIGVM